MTEGHAPEQQRPPWWCWVLLCTSVFAVSSAGVAFTYIHEVPALTLASWRLQLTAVITTLAAAVQWHTSMSAENRARFRKDLGYTAVSGLSLTLHFGTWVWSLQHTSLAHSLLLVSTSPIINVGVALVMRHPISAGEIVGSMLALAGCGVLAAGAASGREVSVTLWGDLAAFVAAVAVVAHWQIGQKLRSYQPVFVYSAPVTVMAAGLLTLTGFLAETRSFLGAPGERHGAFGWLLSGRLAPVVVYLGVVPGIVGHQGFNTVLKYMTPLLVSLAVQFEPVLGPLLGWATGVAAAPGLFTWIGGSIVLLATLGATIATAKRQQQEEREAKARLLVKNKSMMAAADAAGGSSYAAVARDEASADSDPDHDHHLSLAAAENGCSHGQHGDRVSCIPQTGGLDDAEQEKHQLLPTGMMRSSFQQHMGSNARHGALQQKQTEIELLGVPHVSRGGQ